MALAAGEEADSKKAFRQIAETPFTNALRQGKR
jgi:hypothetical protein